MSEETSTFKDVADDAVSNMKGLLKLASEQEAELVKAKQDNQALTEKVAGLTKDVEALRTEKNASVSSDNVKDYISFLVDRGLVKAADEQGILDDIDEDPDRLIKLAKYVVEISAGSLPQGTGISKAASGTATNETLSEWKEDGWIE